MLYKPFRQGVTIHEICENDTVEAAAAVLAAAIGIGRRGGDFLGADGKV